MKKTLKVTFPQKCTGCELCVMAVQRQLGLVGLDGSLVRIFRKDDSASQERRAEYQIEMDPKINDLDISKIQKICPTGVFTIEEEEQA